MGVLEEGRTALDTPALPEPMLLAASAPPGLTLKLKPVLSPDLASHKHAQIEEMAETGRRQQQCDEQWAQSLAGWDAHKRLLANQQHKLVSSRQREARRQADLSAEQEAADTSRERRALLRALGEQHAAEAEQSRQSAEEAAAHRHRLHLEHEAYLARLRREEARREREAQRATEAKEGLLRLATGRTEEVRRQKVAHSAAERREYERRRRRCEAAQRAKAARLAEEERQFQERERQKAERLAAHRARQEHEAGERARRHDEQMSRSSSSLRAALDARLELTTRRHALSSARSECHLGRVRAAQEASAREQQERYDAALDSARRTVAALDSARMREVAARMGAEQGRADELWRRRRARDAEAFAHTSSQARLSHALTDAQWRLLARPRAQSVKADFTRGEVSQQLGAAHRLGARGSWSTGSLGSAGSARARSTKQLMGATA